MVRLPTPGSDNGVWGDVLNDFLMQSHKLDGTLKDESIQASAITDGTISETKLSPATQAKLNQTWPTTIPEITGLQNALDAKAVDANVIHTTGSETIAGTKTFSDPFIASSTINTQSYQLSNSTGTSDIFGLYYNTGAAATKAQGSLSTNSGFSSPVAFPNEEGWYPYWSYKTADIVETSTDGVTWIPQTASAYNSLFAYQPSTVTITTQYIRFTFSQPTFTYLGLIIARYTSATSDFPLVSMTAEALDNTGAPFQNLGTATPKNVFDGAIQALKFSEYNGNTYGTRVTFNSTTWVSGSNFRIGSLMAYHSKPGSGRSFQDKFPFTWNATPDITTRAGLNITGSVTLPNAGNIVLGTGAGTKLGTATTQKLGFYNATPVVQPTGNALTALTNLGLVASPTLTSTNVGLGNVDNTSDATKNSATATLTNKRVTARVSATASSSTPTPNADTDDGYKITALAANATFGAPTGTPTSMQKLIIRVKDNGTARTLSWNAIYRAIGTPLPAGTFASKTLYCLFIYNSDDAKWDLVSAVQEL